MDSIHERLPVLLFLYWYCVLACQSTITTPRFRSDKSPSNQCTFQSTVGYHDLIVRDTDSLRSLILNDASNTIISSAFCIERESNRPLSKQSTTLGIMELSANEKGGIVGIGSSNINKCHLKSCIPDPRHLKSSTDRSILLTLSDILTSATHLEGGDIHSMAANFYLIGGGGGTLSIAILTEFPKITLDVTEIDTKIIEIARSYFGFASSTRNSGKLTIYNSDGRDFIQSSKGYYDVVIIDAAQNNQDDSNPPLRLLTYQFFQELIRAMNKKQAVLLVRLNGMNKAGLNDALKTQVELFGDGRVFYRKTNAPNDYLVVAFHINSVTTIEDSIEMSKQLLGKSFQRFQRPIVDEAQVLCDPGTAKCAT